MVVVKESDLVGCGGRLRFEAANARGRVAGPDHKSASACEWGPEVEHPVSQWKTVLRLPGHVAFGHDFPETLGGQAGRRGGREGSRDDRYRHQELLHGFAS